MHKRIKKIIGVLGIAIACSILISSPAFAQSGGGSYGGGGGGNFGFINQKAEVKYSTRWSLDEWLEQRNKMRWEDLWLSLHSPTPYEFFVSGGANFLHSSVLSQKTAASYGVGAYAQIVGLEYDHETIVTKADNFRLHLRIFGTNVQNTNLTLFAGIRQRSDSGDYRQGYVGASITLYLTKFFGVNLAYRDYLGSSPNSSLGKVTGYRYEAGPFIDFKALRLFGNYIYESESAPGTSTAYSAIASGWILGARLFL